MTTTPKEKVAFNLRFDKPIALDDAALRWRQVRLAIGVAVTVATLILVFLVSVAFPAKVGNSGFSWTLRSPLASGVPAINDYVLSSETLGGLRANTRIFESLFREHSIVKVVAVPGDELSMNSGIISVNGKSTGYTGDVSGGSRLSAKYLVLCRAGACEKDTLFTIPTMNVLGKTSFDEDAARSTPAPFQE